MKKLLVYLFLMAIGISVNAQSSSTGYINVHSAGMYHGHSESIDGVLYVLSNASDHAPYSLVKFPQSKNVTTYTVLDKTLYIDKGAFQGNKFIQTIRIPSSVEYIGENAFDGCENLKSIEVYASSSSDQTINRGDVNEDGEVNIGDVNELIGLILGYIREHPEILEQIRK